MVERQKTKSMAAKRCKNRKKISLSSKKKTNYKGDTKNDIDLNQANNKYLL